MAKAMIRSCFLIILVGTALVVLTGTTPENQTSTIRALEQRLKALESSSSVEAEQNKQILDRITALEERVTQYSLGDAQRQEKLEACVKQADQSFYNFQTSRGSQGEDGKLYVDAETMKDAREFWRGRMEVCRTLYGRGLEVAPPSR